MRCPANMPHIRQSRPDSDFDFKAKVLESFGFVPFLLLASGGTVRVCASSRSPF